MHTCPELKAPRNGSILYQNDGSELPNELEHLEFGTIAVYTCDHGFGFSSGDRTRMCQYSGNNTVDGWSGIDPNCTGK